MSTKGQKKKIYIVGGISQGIPIPKPRQTRESIFSFEAHGLKPGDSFRILAERHHAILACAKLQGVKIKTRTVDSQHIRVWVCENEDA